MLIIPVQDRIDWRRPPLLALALVLVNVLMYLYSVSHDRGLYQQLDEMDTQAMQRAEWPLLMTHLQEEDVLAWHELRNADSDDQRDMLWQYWMDRDWDQHVHAVWEQGGETDPAWQRQRRAMEAVRDDITWVRWGFRPAQPTFAAAVISTFLHADHWHLFGNMLFLLLFAPALERHWGAGKLFVVYMFTGFTASLLHWAVEPGSNVPSIGASGAVSGLMGAYVATYGLRRIEFFYTLGFVFGSFRAPALMVFPAWLGKELFEHMVSDSNVNYMAHAGGMLGGLASIMVLRWRAPAHQPVEAPAMQVVEQRPAVPARLQRLYDELAFDQAWRGAMARLVEAPTEQALWGFAFEAAQKCGAASLDKTMVDAFKLLGSNTQRDGLLARLVQRYTALGGATSRLPPACGLIEAEMLVRLGRPAEARVRLQALDVRWQHPRRARLEAQLAQGGY